jgi:hypothetical protein
MGLRTRRAVASGGIVVFLTAYIWAAIAVGERIPDHPLALLAYYALAGTLWGLPLFPLLSWAEGKPMWGRRDARTDA